MLVALAAGDHELLTWLESKGAATTLAFGFTLSQEQVPEPLQGAWRKANAACDAGCLAESAPRLHTAVGNKELARGQALSNRLLLRPRLRL